MTKEFDVREALRILSVLDLPPKELRVYVACLRLGESPVVPIATAAGFPRTTALYALERLAHRGFVVVSKRKSRHVYAVTPLRQVLLLLRREEEHVRERAAVFEAALPDLLRLSPETAGQPRVRIFHGTEIRAIYEEILDLPIRETLFIGGMRDVAEIVGRRYLSAWMHRRAAVGIATRAIRVGEREIAERTFHDAGLLREVRIPPKGFASPAHIIIYSDRVASITTAKESFGLVTQSADIATSMTQLFETLWARSKRVA